MHREITCNNKNLWYYIQQRGLYDRKWAVNMKVVFLDIHGVLQPYNAERRFREFPNRNKIIAELSEKHNIDYFKYHYYDVLAAYIDWNKDSVDRLKEALDKTGSQIIVSSDCKSKYEPNKMHDLLEIHDLGKYWYADNTIITNRFRFMNNFRTEDIIRKKEIMHSLKVYPIETFVVLDDMQRMKKHFPENSVITHDYMRDDDMNECIKILTKQNIKK